VSFGEDGSIHVHDGTARVLHLHRSKNITAYAARGNEIITAGQNGIFRRLSIGPEVPQIQEFVLCEQRRKKEVKPPRAPRSVTVLEDGHAVIGVAGGFLIALPEDREIFRSDNDIGAIYHVVSHGNWYFAASANHWLIVGHGIDFARHFLYAETVTVISLALNAELLAVVCSDNSLRVLNHDGVEQTVLPLSDFFMKPPVSLTVHPSAPTVAIGGHSSRICIAEFGPGFATRETAVLAAASSDGFQGLAFRDDFLYCASRSDGAVSIFSQRDGNWVLKSSWQIPAQAKTTVHLQIGPHNNALISSLIGDSVGIWDVATQTVLVTFPINVPRGQIAIYASDGRFSAAWIDKTSKVSVIHRGPSLRSYFIGVPFHGLRGLSGSKVSDSLIVTGSCDRDVRVWRISDGTVSCVDEVQGTDSGTHAVCVTGDLVFTGGSRGMVYVWRITGGFLYRLHVSTLSDAKSKCKVRITAMAVSPALRLLVALSDGTLRFYDYVLNDDSLQLIETTNSVGVGISAAFANGIFAVATSRGECHFFGEISGSSSLHACGVHCVRLFEYNSVVYAASGADDGAVGICRLHASGAFPVMSIKRGHIGGVKSVAVDVTGGVCRVCSFSYDQEIRLSVVDPGAGRVLETRELSASVPEGEFVEFVHGGVLAFGAGIQFLHV
jgi:WD40 repeat protein